MSPKWLSDTLFELDGVRFRLDFGPPPARRPSTHEEFCLVKTSAFVEMYLELAASEANAILELGMFEGGSIVFFERLFKPRQLVGVELAERRIPALDRYVAERGSVIKSYHGTSQDDASRLREILEREFPNGIDLVVDDASHLYGPSRTSFEVCFPYLNTGGRYVLEDWSWSHQAPAQSSAHPWYREEALTNLVFEWTVAVGRRSEVARVDVRRNAAIVHKDANAAAAAPLSENEQALRSRTLQKI